MRCASRTPDRGKAACPVRHRWVQVVFSPGLFLKLRLSANHLGSLQYYYYYYKIPRHSMMYVFHQSGVIPWRLTYNTLPLHQCRVGHHTQSRTICWSCRIHRFGSWPQNKSPRRRAPRFKGRSAEDMKRPGHLLRGVGAHMKRALGRCGAHPFLALLQADSLLR
jgi:hypothetical protein